MTSQGSAITRFERAVKTGNPNIVLAAAHELPKPILSLTIARVRAALDGLRVSRQELIDEAFGAGAKRAIIVGERT